MSLPGEPEEPPQQPHSYAQLRLRSVPRAEEPELGCRFLRQPRNVPDSWSYIFPSGFTVGTSHTSRVSSSEVISGSAPYWEVSSPRV